MGNKKFYLYIDECGDQNLANFDANFPIFTLCGIIVSEENRDILTRHILDPDEVNFSFEIIKENLFREGDKILGLKVIPKK